MPTRDDDDEQEKVKRPDPDENTDQPDEVARTRDDSSTRINDQIIKSGMEAREGTVFVRDQFGNPIQNTNRSEPVVSTRVKVGENSVDHTHKFYPTGTSMAFATPAEMKVSRQADGSTEYTVASPNGEIEVSSTVQTNADGGRTITSTGRREGNLQLRTDAEGNLTEFSRQVDGVNVSFRPGMDAENSLQINGKSLSQLTPEKIQEAMNLIAMTVQQIADSLGLDIKMPRLDASRTSADESSAALRLFIDNLATRNAPDVMGNPADHSHHTTEAVGEEGAMPSPGDSRATTEAMGEEGAMPAPADFRSTTEAAGEEGAVPRPQVLPDLDREPVNRDRDHDHHRDHSADQREEEEEEEQEQQEDEEGEQEQGEEEETQFVSTSIDNDNDVSDPVQRNTNETDGTDEAPAPPARDPFRFALAAGELPGNGTVSDVPGGNNPVFQAMQLQAQEGQAGPGPGPGGPPGAGFDGPPGIPGQAGDIQVPGPPQTSDQANDYAIPDARSYTLPPHPPVEAFPNTNALLSAPGAARNSIQWADAAANNFLSERNPQARQQILESILTQLRHPGHENPQHFLRVYLQLSVVQSAQRIINATTNEERVQATRDYMLFRELTNPNSAIGGANLLEALQQQGLRPPAPGNPGIQVNLGGGGTDFIRAAVAPQGPIPVGGRPNDLPPSLANVFDRPENRGLWEDAARDVANQRREREEGAYNAMDNLLRPNNNLTTAQMQAELQALRQLDAQVPTNPFAGPIQNLEAMNAVRTLLNTNNLQEAQQALQTLQQNQSHLAQAYRGILGDRANGPLNNMEQLQGLRTAHARDLSTRLESDRGELRVQLLMSRMNDFVSHHPIDPPANDSLQTLRNQLQTEIDAGNNRARGPMEWVQTQQLLNQIRDSGGIQAARPLAQELMGMVRRQDGSINQYALSAVTSLLASESPNSINLNRNRLHYDSTEANPLPSYPTRLPQGFDLPHTLRNELAQSLRTLLNDNNLHLTPQQLHTLATGLHRPDPAPQLGQAEQLRSNEFRSTVESILRRELRSNTENATQRDARARAIMEAFANGATGLSAALLEIADTTAFSQMRQEVDRIARTGDRDAITVLAALASNTVGGGDRSQEAARVLAEVASANGNQHLNRVTDIVMNMVTQRGDNGRLLETLGNLSFLSSTPNFDVGMALWRGYIRSYDPSLMSSFDRQGPATPIAANDYSATPVANNDAQTQSAHRQSAAFALLSDPRHLNDPIISSISSMMTREMATALHEVVPNLSENQRTQFMERISRELSYAPTNSRDLSADSINRIQNQMLAFQAFAAFAGPSELRTALRPYLEMTPPPENSPLRQQFNRMQEMALEGVLSMFNSPNQQTRSEVFSYLESRQWPPHLMRHLRDGMADLVQSARHISIQEIQRAVRLVPGSEISPPLTAVLHQAGVRSNDMQRLANDIISRNRDNPEQFRNYTMPILMAASAWENMSPEMRNQFRDFNIPQFNSNEIAEALARGEHPPAFDFLLGLNDRIQNQIRSIEADNTELRRQIEFEDRLYNDPPRVHANMLQELRQLEAAEERWRAEQLGTGGASVIYSAVRSQFLPESPQHQRITQIKEWLETRPLRPDGTLDPNPLNDENRRRVVVGSGTGYTLDSERYFRRLEQIGQRLASNAQDLGNLRLAEAQMLYPQMRAMGRNQDADSLLVSMWSHNQLPESLRGDFDQLWRRMHQLGVAPTETPPNFTGTQQQQYQQALDVLSNMRTHNNPDAALNSIENAMARAISHRAQSIIMSQPAVTTAQGLENQYRRHTSNLLNYFQVIAATEDGQRDQHLIDHVQQIGRDLDGIFRTSGPEARQNLGAMVTELQTRLNNLPPGSPARDSIQNMLTQMRATDSIINPDSATNRDHLRPIVADCVDGRPLRNHNWFERSAASLIRFAVVTPICAATQAGCELLNVVPGLGHAVSMFVVPAVATGSNHVVDESLYYFGLSNRGSYLLDAGLGRYQYDPISRSHFQLSGSQAMGMLGRQYAAEFEMNAAAAGFGWLGGRVGQLAGRTMGLTERAAAPAVTSFGSRFAQNLRGMIGPGLVMTSVEMVNGEARLNLPTALLGLGVSFTHGAYSHLSQMSRPQAGLQRLLPETASRQPSAALETQLRQAQMLQVNQHIEAQVSAGRMPRPIAERAMTLMQEGHLTPAAVRAISELPPNLRTAHIDSLLTNTRTTPQALETALRNTWQTHLQTQHPAARGMFEQLSRNNQLSMDLINSFHSMAPEHVTRLSSMTEAGRNTLLEASRGLPPQERGNFLRQVGGLSEAHATQISELLRGVPEAQRPQVAGNLSSLSGAEALPRLMDAIQTLPQANRAQALVDASRLPPAIMDAVSSIGDNTARGRMMQSLGAAHAGEVGTRIEQLNNLLTQLPRTHQTNLMEALGSISDGGRRTNALNSLLNQLGNTSNVGPAAVRNFAENLAALPQASQRAAIMDSIAGMPPHVAADFVRAFSSEGPGRGQLLQQLAQMTAQARAEVLRNISEMPSATARNEALNRMMGMNEVQLRQELGSLGRTESAPPITQPRAITPEQQNFINSVSGDARAARNQLVTRANELHLDLPLNRLGSISRENLTQLNTLMQRCLDLRNGQLPGGVSNAQRTAMLQSVESMLANSGNARRGIDFNQVSSSLRAIDAIMGPRNAQFTNEQAGHLAQILATSRTIPPEFFPPFEQLISASPEGLARYRHTLEQLSGMGPPPPGPDMAAWNASQRIQQLLSGSELGQQWAFLPAARGALADQCGIDGTFVNLRTGEVRPLDFKTNNQTGNWIMNIANPQQTLMGNNGLSFVRDFLTRTSNYGLSPEFMNTVGLPSMGRTGNGNPATDLQGLNNYVRNLRDHVTAEQNAGRTPRPEIMEMLRRFENARPTLHGAAAMREQIPTLLTPLLNGQPSGHGRDGNRPYLEYTLNQPFHADYSGTRHDGSAHNQSQHVDTIRVYQDGRIEGRGGGHTWELGNVREIYANAINHLQAQPGSPTLQTQIQGLQNAMNRLNDRQTFIVRPQAAPTEQTPQPQPQPQPQPTQQTPTTQPREQTPTTHPTDHTAPQARVETPQTAPVSQVLRDSTLPGPLKERITAYHDANPTGNEANVRRMLALPQEALNAAGIGDLLNNRPTHEQLSFALRHAEAVNNIGRFPENLREGLNGILSSRPTEARLALVEDILRQGHANLGQLTREYLRLGSEFIGREEIQSMRREVPRRENTEARRPATEAPVRTEALTPQAQRRMLNSAFEDAGAALRERGHNQDTIDKANRLAQRVLAEHFPNAEPIDVVSGANQFGIVLRHPDGSRTVLKMQIDGSEFSNRMGTRERAFDLPRLSMGEGGPSVLRREDWAIYHQPFAEQPTHAQAQALLRRLQAAGISISDLGPAESNITNMGVYRGRTYILDYGSVSY